MMMWWRVVLVCLLVWGMGIRLEGRSYLEVDVDNSEPFVGEVVVYQFRFFDDGASAGKVFSPPIFRGLGQLGESDVIQRSVLSDGVQYTLFEQAFYLTANTSGQFIIEPGRIDAPETPFQDAEVILSETITLDVRPLPDSPYEVLHGVGSYTVALTLERDEVMVGGVVRLRLVVAGRGSLQVVRAPDLLIDESWRIFRNTPQYVFETPITGEKIFTWDLIPQRSGTFRLALDDFVYFEPNEARYEAIALPEFDIVVRGTDRDFGQVDNDSVQGFASSWRDIGASQGGVADWLWVVLWLIPPLAVIGHRWWTGGGWQTGLNVPRQTNAYTRRLSALASLDTTAVHEGVVELLVDYVGHITKRQVTEENFETVLMALPSAHREFIQRCWEEALQGRYAPVDETDARHLLRRVHRLFGKSS